VISRNKNLNIDSEHKLDTTYKDLKPEIEATNIHCIHVSYPCIFYTTEIPNTDSPPQAHIKHPTSSASFSLTNGIPESMPDYVQSNWYAHNTPILADTHTSDMIPCRSCQFKCCRNQCITTKKKYVDDIFMVISDVNLQVLVVLYCTDIVVLQYKIFPPYT